MAGVGKQNTVGEPSVLEYNLSVKGVDDGI